MGGEDTEEGATGEEEIEGSRRSNGYASCSTVLGRIDAPRYAVHTQYTQYI